MSTPALDPAVEHFAPYVGGPVDALPSPSMLVERSVLEANIARMAAAARDLVVALRPHWKASKCVPVGRLQLAAGAVGLTCATVREAEALLDAGVTSIFWAYPAVGPERIRAAVAAAGRAELIVGGDSVENFTELALAATEAGVRVPVRLAVDTGLGRLGVAPDDAVAAARVISGLSGLDFRGIYTHEGQVQGQGADAQRRTATALAAGRLMVEVAETLRADGIECRDVSVGSTPGGATTASIPGITEMRPGTYVYGDENQHAIGTTTDDQIAISVLARVIGIRRGETTIIDAGIKAMSSDGSQHGDGRIGTVTSIPGAVVVTGHEEHGFVRGLGSVSVGDLVRVRPNHACGLSNMHSHVFLVDGDTVVDVWPVSGRH
jgi:D-serine deaminase-like pyridoxal phosphate-dependent protein